MRLGGVLLLLKVVGGVPDLAAFGPTAPDDVLELTSGDRKAAREAMRRHPTRFAVLMMAPRVGTLSRSVTVQAVWRVLALPPKRLTNSSAATKRQCGLFRQRPLMKK